MNRGESGRVDYTVSYVEQHTADRGDGRVRSEREDSRMNDTGSVTLRRVATCAGSVDTIREFEL